MSYTYTGQQRYRTWQSLTERVEQFCAKMIISEISKLSISTWTGSKNLKITLSFRFKMLTSSIIMLSVFGGLVAVLVMWWCIGCMQSLYTKCKHPGQERDTFRYKTSGMVLDCCCGIFFKLPISICARICCPEDNVIHV